MKGTSKTAATSALKQARRAWRLQYLDATTSIALARQALSRADAAQDAYAWAWAQLTCAFHAMRYVGAAQGIGPMEMARDAFEKLGSRHGVIVATIGISRCWWMQGRNRESLDLLLPLRAEGLQLLDEEECGMLLNGIAGCYSMLGDPAQSFAYMYQALRESSPARNRGFDVVLYCNLSHELLMLGDYEESLIYAQEGIERCAKQNNLRLMGVLLLNRMTCLTDLQRAGEALADAQRLLAMPASPDGRGASNPAFEQIAMTVLRAGDLKLGAELIERARESLGADARPDERYELIIAESEMARLSGKPQQAVELLERAMPLPTDGVELRIRCLFFQALSDAHERNGNTARALHCLRTWQALQLQRSHLASKARHQASSLRTELMRLQRQRDDIDARHRSTEKARRELEAANQLLAQKVSQVQALQASLEQLAVRDGLTGLFNRRHLGDVLPGMIALARRDQRPLCLAIIDLDHFKSVNDQYGHLVGDAVLKSFAALLLDGLRKSDIVCRYGGEEFCVLMPRTTAAQGQRKIEALLKSWRTMPLHGNDQPLAPQTFSAGVADSLSSHLPEHADAELLADDLLKRADDCALQAKRRGRNLVVQE
ncbi:MAG: diguanylate cyclase [Betaproteobacteria bacterium]|nr:diguanylate cyclase [Betaproteobacteria bacterium]